MLKSWRFPGGPVAKTLYSQCRGLGSIPGQGTRFPHAATKSSHAAPRAHTLHQGLTRCTERRCTERRCTESSHAAPRAHTLHRGLTRCTEGSHTARQNRRIHTCVCTQSYLTLCSPMDYGSPGSPVHGILQARILEWVAMPSSRASSEPGMETRISNVSCIGRRVLYH